MKQPLPWREPADVAVALARRWGAAGLIWLDSDGSNLGRFSRIGARPLQVLCCHGLPGEPGAWDPFEALEQIEQGGQWLGWLSYEAGAWVEPAPHWRRPAMAQLWAARHPALLVFDHHSRRCWLELETAPPAAGRAGPEGQPSEAALEQAEALQQAWQPLPTTAAPLPPAPPLDPAQWHWHSDPAAFAAGVEQIRRWIAAGDLFQANLTACCEQPWPPNAGNGSEVADPLALVALYLKLRQHCPAPFGALAIGSGSAAGEALLSASPERFLQVDGAGLVETRPIKGTRPRHSNPERDADAAAELVSSPKDRAENVMIVDLLRHDLGRVCELGSITVPQLVGLESYRQVHHLTSVVQGQRRNDVGLAELLRACWPGGSISGAPKIRACQRLSQLEPLPRGAYCGSLFWLGADGRFDSSILIRTLLLANGVLRAHAGGGIVADSDPAAEAEEMGWKIQPLLEALA